MLTDNINTDQIIPSREMKRVSKKGLADGLFANLRYTDAADGGRNPDPDFVLNQPSVQQASILIAGKNFGCGSSREHAAWALHEYGFRVIVAESFGSIFYDNCINNGIVPIMLDHASITKLVRATTQQPVSLQIDLERCEIKTDNLSLSFTIDDDKRHMLMNGHNAIDLTLTQRDAIERFIAQDTTVRPWLYENTQRATL
jgi:3-isopropylmalate/(R)-2-methylmalate dehydratase small subunit